MSVNGKICLWLLDTGAAKSLVTPKFTETFPSLHIKESLIICKGANNEQIPLRGEIYLELNISDELYVCAFQVSTCQIQNLDGIIGMDILTKLKTWNIGGSLQKGAYLQLNNTYLVLRSFINSNNNADKEFNGIMSNMITTKASATNLWYNMFILHDLDVYFPCNMSCDCKLSYLLNNQSIESKNDKVINPSETTQTELDDKTGENKKISEIVESSGPDKFVIDTTISPYTPAGRHEPCNSYYGVDVAVNCKNDTPSPDTSAWPGQPCSFDSENSDAPCPYNKKAMAHSFNIEGTGWKPQYNTLFKLSQETTFSNCYIEDEISKFPVYALEATNFKAGNGTSLRIRTDYTLQNGPVIFTPVYDAQDFQLNTLKISDTCNKRGNLTIYNNTALSRRITQKQVIGYIEIIKHDDVFIPSFECTGDIEKFGKESPWKRDSDEGHLLSTLVSVNQQENAYISSKNDNIYVAGPRPNCNFTESCVYTNVKGSSPEMKKNVKTIVADITDISMFNAADVICQQVNCSLRYPKGLEKKIEMAYPYGSVYYERNKKNNVLPENLLRIPGKCLLKEGGNCENNPTMANLTSQFYFGKPTDGGGFQRNYLKKYDKLYGNKFQHLMNNDTSAQRLIWFKECLQDLADQIKTKQGISNLYFTNTDIIQKKDYKEVIENFTKKLTGTKVNVYIVIDPTSTSKQAFEKYDTKEKENNDNSQEFRHTPGWYKDAPKSFCRDQLCNNCKNNKFILKLFANDFDEEQEKHVKTIENGMEPEVPKFETGNERIQNFSKLLNNMDTSDLSNEQSIQMKDMLSKYSTLFFLSDEDEAGLIKNYEATIDTTGAPISCKPRRFGTKALLIMEQLNQIMLKKGLTRPCDGPWASPVVLVKKKALPGTKQDLNSPSSYRFCIDYRKINQESVIWKAYPTGDLKAMLHKAAGFDYNTTIDITNAFLCVAIREEDQQKTAFQLPSGLWAFTRLPQGLKVSPQIWAKAADKILKPVQDVASWYVDDIFCGSENFDKHLKDVDRVLFQLLQSGLKVRFEKCFFLRKR